MLIIMFQSYGINELWKCPVIICNNLWNWQSCYELNADDYITWRVVVCQFIYITACCIVLSYILMWFVGVSACLLVLMRRGKMTMNLLSGSVFALIDHSHRSVSGLCGSSGTYPEMWIGGQRGAVWEGAVPFPSGVWGCAREKLFKSTVAVLPYFYATVADKYF